MNDWKSETVIRFENVAVKRSDFKLGPATLDIPSGYITAIVGPNGSGKSTLFRMALDLAKPDQGKVTVLGHDVGSGDDDAIKQRIGYLPEEPYAHEEKMKGSDKAKINGFWYKDWDLFRYQELLRILQVNDNQPLGKMSKGMRRKTELALAMAHNPELLLLDEPSSGLDPLAWKAMIDLLHRHMDQGDRTILMTSHIVDEVKRLADFIVFMAQGRVLGFYEKDELFSSWFTYYISGEGLEAGDLADLPGQCGIEFAGQHTFRVTTGKAFEAESWCADAGLRIVSKSAMELDEIMAALLHGIGLETRVNEARGTRR
ncbi:ABC transporter ATP-binding protein [Paenibacillus sp. LHD-117]|uniref:ABC transporter ATP-binding protein n=1 Tax=Paenibacillus sp. LHD-117 TaxID=3071412 RepID=UPI0027E090BC|nr:ABC transporter ATP-binding protein [Paenibacillus sp. LHD-117]MDQ6421375.1 ABC transporter ATP-binding protein [Paenibacillus sp. LHD-117]